MKKYLMAVVALFTILAVAMPSFALEVKYGGLFRLRLQSNENVSDGRDGKYFDPAGVNANARTPFGSLDDNNNYIDQRLRMYFTFVGSENLQVVTKWEADTIWGNEASGNVQALGRHGGGDVGADAVNLEMKNAYLDFAIPMTTARATMGVQGISLLRGWVLDDDFSAAVITAKMDPFNFQVGYVAAINELVNSSDDDVNDYYANIQYASGPLKAGFLVLYQDGNETGRDGANTGNAFTTHTIDPGLFGNGTHQGAGSGPSFGGGFGRAIGGVSALGAAAGNANDMLNFINQTFGNAVPAVGLGDNQHLVDLGINLEYKMSYFSAYLNFVKNLGGWSRANEISGLVDANGKSLNLDQSFDGWMVDAGGNYYCGPWTFTLSGFVTSGGDITKPNDFGDFFRYPAGGGHAWSEIMGSGSLDASVGDGTGAQDVQKFNMGYSSGMQPSNIWTIQAGVAYQLLKGTKLTLNYWYIGTVEDAVSDATLFFRTAQAGLASMDDLKTSDSIGHEINFYLDQQVVDGLNLRLVGAYLFAEGAYSVFPKDDDAYELGAVLQWSF